MEPSTTKQIRFGMYCCRFTVIISGLEHPRISYHHEIIHIYINETFGILLDVSLRLYMPMSSCGLRIKLDLVWSDFTTTQKPTMPMLIEEAWKAVVYKTHI